MKESESVKLQAITIVFLMVISGLMVMINTQSDEVSAIDDWTDYTTWFVDEDYTIAEGETVYVDDRNGDAVGDPQIDFPAHTGVVIGSSTNPEGVTLTVQGTLVIEEGSLWVGGGEPPAFLMPLFGHLEIDGGTIRFQTNGEPTYSINGNGHIDIQNGVIQNNGTENTNGDGDGSNADVFRFMANQSLSIKDSFIEDLAGSSEVSNIPEFTVYTGGIHIRNPSTGDLSTTFFSIENTNINNSKVGLSFEDTPYNKAYIDTVSFTNFTNGEIHLNFTGSAPILVNCSADEDWVVWIQDDYRETEFSMTYNESHPVMVNCGDVDEDNVDIYYGTTEVPPKINLDSESTLNVSAMVDVIVRDQAGNDVVGAAVQVNSSLYDLKHTPDHGNFLGNNTVFSGLTNSTGVAASIPIPLYSIYQHTSFSPEPAPGSLSQTKYTQSNGEWNTMANVTAGETVESRTINNNSADPIEMDTGNIIIVLNLKPDFEARKIGTFNVPPIAGDVIEFYEKIDNVGTMGAYCDIAYYNESVDEDHLIDLYTNVYIEAGGYIFIDSVRRVKWNTTKDMGDKTHTIIVNITDKSGWETQLGNNQRPGDFYLERPTPDLEPIIRFDNDAPVDGDEVMIIANITNNGRANASAISVSFWLGDPADGVQIGANQTYNDLYTKNYAGNSTELSVIWNTTNMANDNETEFAYSLNQTFVYHNIYVWLEYNNTEDPNPLKTKNTTNQTELRLNKYYDVEFLPAEQFEYVNEEVPYTIYTYEVKNTGRAVDSVEFIVDRWSSNDTNINEWSYVVYSDNSANLLGEQIFLIPGEVVTIYVNVSVNWNGINQGELFVLNINASSVNGTASRMMVIATTSAGTVDYNPTEITFRRADGKQVFNQGNAPDSILKSLVANENSTLTVQIKNEGTAGSVFSFDVTFYIDVFGSPISIGSVTFSEYIPAGFSKSASIEYMFTSEGLKKISVKVDSLDGIGELNEDNNWKDMEIYVKNESMAYDFTISGIAFDWDGQTPLPGATIRLRDEVTGYIDKVTTDEKGRYTLVLPMKFNSDDGIVSNNDNDRITIRATHPPDPAEDSKTLYFYSEDLEITNIDLYLFVFGVDLTFQPKLGYNLSFVREDGMNTNQPIVGEETIIRFWIVNRGTIGTNATFQITKNGTSSVNLIGYPLETLDAYDAQSISMVEYTHIFTDPEVVNFDINIVDDNSLETYTTNNLVRREGVKIKSRLTNEPYIINGTVYQRASGSENVFAPDTNVTITNIRTNYSFTTITNDFGWFTYNLKNLPEGYEEGDLIHVRAWKEDKEGVKEFYAYSEDKESYLVIVFATYDVRVTASDVRHPVAPGGMTTYEIVVFNTGNMNDKFQLQLAGDYVGWGALRDDDYELSINAGMSTTVILSVDVPASYNVATAGLQAHIIVIAISNNGNGPSDSVDIYTEVIQIFNIDISVNRTTGIALPGKSVSYNITITNNGNGNDTILLGLSGTHSSWGELSVYILLVQRGTSQYVILTVSIPDFTLAWDNAVFQVSALSLGGTTTTSTPLITTTVDEFFRLEIAVGTSTQFGNPGSSITYDITVYNRGNSQQQIIFTIEGDDIGVISGIPPLNGFSSTVTTLQVNIPQTANSTAKFHNLISAYRSGYIDETSNTLSITTLVNEIFEKPELSVQGGINEKTIGPDETVIFTLRINNSANTDDTFSFSVIYNNTDFKYDIQALAIASGSFGFAYLSITGPRNAVFNDFAELNVQAISSHGLKSDPMVNPIKVTVKHYVYGVELDIDDSERQKYINLGESVSHSIIVKNSGDYLNHDTQLSLKIINLDPPDADWIIDVQSPVILERGEESREVSIFVRAPSISNTRESISFNVKATVILPKIVGGSENDSHYSAEIAGIVTIVNQKPEVTILPPWGPSGTDYYYKETLEFQAIASDPDSDNDEALTYLWDFGDGSMLDEQNFIAKPVHSYDLPGTYQVSLTVTDEFGESNTDIDPVKVGNNKPEVLSIRTDTGKTNFGKGEVKFIVDPKDEDITTLDYTWYFGDGSVATISGETSINHTFTRTGSIIVTCVAFDEFGGFGSNSLTITIENNAPVPVFNVVFDGKTYDFDDDKRIEIEEDDEVSFDASGSFDPDADHGDKIISYNWIFGDGTVGSGVQPTHIYKDKFEDGYEISLTITDSEGKQVTLKGTVLIVVKEKDVETPTYVYLVIAILVAFVLFLGVMFVRTPKRFFGAMKKGTAQAEMSALIDKLNVLEGKLGVGGAAAASSFAPGEQKFCDNCGAGNEMDGKFCESCGSPLT